MLITTKMYSLNEVSILPSSVPTEISSRSQVNPHDENGKLPIFVSPMTSIIDANNFKTFNDSKVIPIMPRSSGIEVPDGCWQAMSLAEFQKAVETLTPLSNKKILIDIANGHMKAIYDLVQKAKDICPNVTIMIGNIAHPSMYLNCCQVGVDYVRVGIGGGNGCSTSVQTGIHASLPFLLSEIQSIKQSSYYDNKTITKVIADGGVDSTAKAIKCLALGADYVMMGRMFAECEEACGQIITLKGERYRMYYGMASELGQLALNGAVTKNPEGVTSFVEVNKTLSEYCDDFEAALRSSMSYTGAKDLHDFTNYTVTKIQSLDEFNSYQK